MSNFAEIQIFLSVWTTAAIIPYKILSNSIRPDSGLVTCFELDTLRCLIIIKSIGLGVVQRSSVEIMSVELIRGVRRGNAIHCNGCWNFTLHQLSGSSSTAPH